MPKNFVNNLQDIGYESGCPSRPFRPIFKVKRASKRAYPSFQRLSCAITNHFLGDLDFNFKMLKYFVDVHQHLIYDSGWPSRQLRPIFKQIIFWVIRISTSKFFVKVRQNLGYLSGWPSQPFRPILKVKQFLKRAYPPFRYFSCAITNHFVVDPDSDVKKAKNFCGHFSRPFLCIRLSLTAILTHF
uniref:Uncharacterized protein n=1 Tax=Solanum lycopersicum TaxID=4081 RepID=A0A3Q7FFE1_SOLLC